MIFYFVLVTFSDRFFPIKLLNGCDGRTDERTEIHGYFDDIDMCFKPVPNQPLTLRDIFSIFNIRNDLIK